MKTCQRVWEIPITDVIIKAVEAMGEAQGIESLKLQTRRKPIFYPADWIAGVEYANDEYDEDDDDDDDENNDNENDDDEEAYDHIDQADIDEIFADDGNEQHQAQPDANPIDDEIDEVDDDPAEPEEDPEPEPEPGDPDQPA